MSLFKAHPRQSLQGGSVPRLLEVLPETSAPWDAGWSLQGCSSGGQSAPGCGDTGLGPASSRLCAAALPRQRLCCPAGTEGSREPVPTTAAQGHQPAGRHGHGHRRRDALTLWASLSLLHAPAKRNPQGNALEGPSLAAASGSGAGDPRTEASEDTLGELERHVSSP